jgi:flavin-dependent dehydrogenase
MRSECVIAGGGPAGCALAIKLARAGRQVVLIEKTAQPHHKVCGEFLSHEALGYLYDLGIDLAALGAVPICSLRVIRGDEALASALPFPALSLSRWRLDEALLLGAGAAGALVIRGQAVEQISGAPGAWDIKLTSEEHILTDTVFLASGKHDVRGWGRPPGPQSDLIAFKIHWRLTQCNTQALQNHVELVLFPGGYCGLELVEDGIANLCLLVRKTGFAGSGSRWPSLIEAVIGSSSLFSQRLCGAMPLWPSPISVSAIPYGYIQEQPDGLWRVGDQFAVIPSFCGDGISLALHGAALAAACYLAGEDQEAFRQKMARQIRWRVRMATAISRMLVSPPGQKLIVSASSLWPRALACVAAATRIPRRAIIKAPSCKHQSVS